MKNDFICPNCRGYLNTGDRIVFTIKKHNWKGGLLLLSPLLGDYSYDHHTSYTIAPGEKLEFHCPICDYDLSIEGTDNLAKVLMSDADKKVFTVVFSKREGEKCTYKISDIKIEAEYGEHAPRNLDLLSTSFFK